MKKIVLTLVAMLSLTSMFAEDTKSVNVNTPVEAKYVLNINTRALSRTLELDPETATSVDAISKDFSNDMLKVGALKGEERAKAFKKAINKNLGYMHAVLSYDQYRKYVQLLNVTVANRGLGADDK